MSLCAGRRDLREWVQRSIDNAVPISGAMSLTYRCNLRCVHCYACSSGDIDRELSTSHWLSILSDAIDAGMLFILITGGEPLIRPDFPEIYRFLVERGVRVTLFTNATLVTPEIIDLFRELPPWHIEVSVYGASEETYRRITGVDGAFLSAVGGVTALLDAGLRVEAKTVLLTLNSEEFSEIESLCRELTGSFRYDSMIVPAFDGDRSAERLRVPVEESIKHEFMIPGIADEWRREKERYEGLPPSDRLYQCGAGRKTFCISPYGILKPCIVATSSLVEIGGCGFIDAWRSMVDSLERKNLPETHPCRGCSLRFACSNCPAVAMLDSGSETGYSAYACEVAHFRAGILDGTRKMGGCDELQ